MFTSPSFLILESSRFSTFDAYTIEEILSFDELRLTSDKSDVSEGIDLHTLKVLDIVPSI
jgi:hypothetical protein